VAAFTARLKWCPDEKLKQKEVPFEFAPGYGALALTRAKAPAQLRRFFRGVKTPRFHPSPYLSG
jgi:hypothetical protein